MNEKKNGGKQCQSVETKKQTKEKSAYLGWDLLGRETGQTFSVVQ